MSWLPTKDIIPWNEVGWLNSWDPQEFGDGIWTPAKITTIGWWDASDANSITDSGGDVSKIDDKSGKDFHLSEGVGSNQPKTNQRTFNGLNVLDHEDTTQRLSNENWTSPSDDLTLFIVAGVDAISGATQSMMSIGSGGGGTNRYGYDALNTSQFNSRMRLSFQGNPNAINTPHNGPSVYSNTFDRTNDSIYGHVDGNAWIGPQNYLAATLDVDNVRIGVFRGYDNNQGIDGFWGEYIVVNDISEETRQLIEGYLAVKWSGWL